MRDPTWSSAAISAPIRAVVFDRDQTLLRDESHRLIGRYQTVLPELTEDDLAAQWYRTRHLVPADPDRDLEFWSWFFRCVVEAKGGTSEQAGQITRLFFQIHTLYSKFSDTLPCLTELRHRGYRLAILTNHPLGDVETAFGHVGLDPTWFDVILNAYPDPKPSPHAYRRILKALELAAGECLFVDDEIDNVRAAMAVGMPAVLIERSEAPTAYPGITTIDGLDRLLHICEQRTGGTDGEDSRRDNGVPRRFGGRRL